MVTDADGYMTEYAGWMMNRERFIDCLDKAGFALERQFLGSRYGQGGY